MFRVEWSSIVERTDRIIVQKNLRDLHKCNNIKNAKQIVFGGDKLLNKWHWTNGIPIKIQLGPHTEHHNKF